jgi:hypothetical protein
MAHTLVVYTASPRGDATLREAVRTGGELTVVALAPQEPASGPRCCGNPHYWNGVQRELAGSELARARLAVEGAEEVTLEVLRHDVLHPTEAIIRRAAAVGAARIVLADAHASRLGRRAVRRLRRRSAVPVAD